MAEEQNPEKPASETTVEAPAADTPKVFTQDEVNRLVGKARQDARASALKETKQAPQTPAPAPSVNEDPGGERLTMKQLAEQNARLQRKMEFRDLADEHGIPREARADLFDLYEAQKPEDPTAWVAAKKSWLGNGQPVKPETPAAPAAPASPPAAAPNAPNAVNPLTTGGLVNLFALTDAQIETMPVSELRGHFEKIIEHGRTTSGAPPRPVPGTPRK